MHPEIARKREDLIALCRRFGVTRLAVFGSAARGTGFDLARSDVDLLIKFAPAVSTDLAIFGDLKSALEALFERPVDLLEYEAIEASRNYIRRRQILEEAEEVYG